MTLTVIVCSHNPREDYLRRTLEGLKSQTLPGDQWELLLIDNHSDQPLETRIDLSWHPHARIIREDELGLTPARLRGIRESRSDRLLFVDDDNILDRAYLAEAVEIGRKHPNIGVYGGVIVPEFETEPPIHTKPLWQSLALRSFDSDLWANFPLYPGPCGAGLCVQKPVAVRYAGTLATCPIRRTLDRKGASLASAGDDDIILTAIDMGLGIGMFTALKLVHLIAARRCTEEYLLRLEESIVCSGTLLDYAKGGSPHQPGNDGRSLQRRMFSTFVATAENLLSGAMQRKRRAAHGRGRQAALNRIAEIEASKNQPVA